MMSAKQPGLDGGHRNNNGATRAKNGNATVASWRLFVLVICVLIPISAHALQPAELSDLLARILPANGFESLGWDDLVDDPNIQWKTDGVAQRSGLSGQPVISYRDGVTRILVNGRPSRLLRQHWQELGWTITLRTEGNARFGPKLIEVQPGVSGSACFGTNAEGCTFTADDVLRSKLLQATAVCESHWGEERYAAYSVSTPGKQASLVVFRTSGGSGGSTSWMDVQALTDRTAVCNEKLAPG